MPVTRRAEVRSSFLARACTLIAGLLSATVTHADTAPPDWSTLKTPVGELRYKLILPPKFDAKQTYPTLLALPPGPQTEAMVSGTLSLWTTEAAKRGWVVIAPAAPEGKLFVREGVDAIVPMLEAVGTTVKFAGGRVHVAGISNGGRSAFHFAAKSPWLVHSILTLPGGAQGEDFAGLSKLVSIPVTLFVGAEDKGWVELNQATKAELDRLGGTASLDIIPGAGHALRVEPSKLFDILDHAHMQSTRASAAAAEHVAVVELFTSEGCSSCPPADEVLSKLAKGDDAQASRVIPLAFHVDYWDRLGWPDRFAKSSFTQRQEQVARRLGDKSKYTPQMVINGRSGFVGSDAERANTQIAGELKRDRGSSGTLLIRRQPRKADTAPITIEVFAPQAKGVTVVAALVEDGLVSDVKAGENAGRTLRHDRVVRVMSTGTLAADHTVTMRLAVPKDVKLENARVVVLLQDTKTGEIASAAQISAGEAKR